MKQKTILLLVILVVVIGIGALSIIRFQKGKEIIQPPVTLEKPEGGAEEIIIRTDEEAAAFLPVEPVDWTNPEKPMQSPVLEEGEIPKEAIKIGMTAKGFNPPSFEVKKGEKVVLAVTSQDQWTHIFKFKDPALAKIGVGVGPGQARIIMFYAPEEAGEYPFFCSVPGHEEVWGEKGKMIVR